MALAPISQPYYAPSLSQSLYSESSTLNLGSQSISLGTTDATANLGLGSIKSAMAADGYPEKEGFLNSIWRVVYRALGISKEDCELAKQKKNLLRAIGDSCEGECLSFEPDVIRLNFVNYKVDYSDRGGEPINYDEHVALNWLMKIHDSKGDESDLNVTQCVQSVVSNRESGFGDFNSFVINDRFLRQDDIFQHINDSELALLASTFQQNAKLSEDVTSTHNFNHCTQITPSVIVEHAVQGLVAPGFTTYRDFESTPLNRYHIPEDMMNAIQEIFSQMIQSCYSTEEGPRAIACPMDEVATTPAVTTIITLQSASAPETSTGAIEVLQDPVGQDNDQYKLHVIAFLVSVSFACFIAKVVVMHYSRKEEEKIRDWQKILDV